MLVSNGPEKGTSKMEQLISDPAFFAEMRNKLSIHGRMTKAVEGRSACLNCGWVADVNDETWSLDDIPECVP
jgi:hypothetical protein